MASEPDNTEDAEAPLGLLQVLGSALAAAIGVQSREKRARDFARGKPVQFIVVGLVLTALFVVGVVLVVRLVLHSVT